MSEESYRSRRAQDTPRGGSNRVGQGRRISSPSVAQSYQGFRSLRSLPSRNDDQYHTCSKHSRRMGRRLDRELSFKRSVAIPKEQYYVLLTNVKQSERRWIEFAMMGLLE